MHRLRFQFPNDFFDTAQMLIFFQGLTYDLRIWTATV